MDEGFGFTIKLTINPNLLSLTSCDSHEKDSRALAGNLIFEITVSNPQASYTGTNFVPYYAGEMLRRCRCTKDVLRQQNLHLFRMIPSNTIPLANTDQ